MKVNINNRLLLLCLRLLRRGWSHPHVARRTGLGIKQVAYLAKRQAGKAEARYHPARRLAPIEFKAVPAYHCEGCGRPVTWSPCVVCHARGASQANDRTGQTA